jgi:hypothetical protein
MTFMCRNLYVQEEIFNWTKGVIYIYIYECLCGDGGRVRERERDGFLSHGRITIILM